MVIVPDRALYPIGSRIREIRLNLGLSLKEIADRAGTSAPTMHRYESGYDGYTFSTLKKIAAALDCDLEIRFRPRHRQETGRGTGAEIPAVKPSRDDLHESVHSLFWDRKISAADLDEYAVWALRRILTEGNLEQVRLATAYYGTERIAEVLRSRGLDEKTRSFWEHQLRGRR